MITEEEIFRALDGGKVGLPPLAVSLLERNPTRMLAEDSYRPDALVGVSWGRRRWKFLAELKANATPQAFEGAVTASPRREQNAVESDGRPALPLGRKPRTPRRGRRERSRLVRQRRRHRTGRSSRRPGGGSPTASPGPSRSATFPWRQLARRRVFLAKPVYRAVGEIVTTIQGKGGKVSFATVSKVLKTLARTSSSVGLRIRSRFSSRTSCSTSSPPITDRRRSPDDGSVR